LARDESPAAPIPAELPALQLGTAGGLAIRGRIARGDVAPLCDHGRALLEAADSEVVICDVGAIVDPDATAVDALARLQLAARRLGRRIRLTHASGDLQDLLALMGLGEIVPLDPGLRVQTRGEPEEREVALGVEEETDPGDLPT